MISKIIPSQARYTEKPLSRLTRTVLATPVLCFCAMPITAHAQGDPEANRATLEEVLVTAQRVEQNVQQVPVAVTTLGADALEKARVTTAHDLLGLAPNVWIVPQTSSGAAPSATIRGVNSNVGLNSNDGGVAFYVDDVYMASNLGAVLEISDIERVEVLRGPQGTLFGRNTTGGAINFITRAPAGEFGIRQDLSFGNYSLFSSRTRIETPELNGFSASLSYFTMERDGDVRNLTPGRIVDYGPFKQGNIGRVRTPDELGEKDSESWRLALRYAPGERLIVDYRYMYTESSHVPKAIQVLGFSNGPGGVAARNFYAAQPPGTPNFVSGERLDAVSNPYASPEFLEVDFHALTIEYELNNWLTVKNIASYREQDNWAARDLAGGGGLVIPGTDLPFTLFLSVNERANRQETNEFQLIGSHERFDWVAGLYYSEITFPTGGRYDSINVSFYPMPAEQGGVFNPRPTNPRGFIENSAYAVFGQGTWHASDKLDLTLGVRQSRDKRAGLSSSTRESFDESYSHTDYTAIATYFVSDDVTTYGKVSTGYLSAGVAGADQTPFDEEEVLQFEVGMKGEFLDQRLRANLAAFYSDYKDIQVLDFSTGQVIFVNAAKAEVQGFEAEITAIPMPGLTLGAVYGYTDFEYEEFVLGGVDVKDTQREWFRPEHTGNLNAEYQFQPFNWGGELSARVEAQYLSRVYFTPILVDPVSDRNSIADARWVINARATLAEIPLGSTRARIGLWGKNLTDEDELEFAAAVGTTVVGSFMTPRTYGVDLTIEL